MATIVVRCPKCGSEKVIKHGTSATGEQRYMCKNDECKNKSFMLNYKYNGRKPGIDISIIEMTANSSGIRDISRVLKISTDKVMSTLKKQKTQ